MAVSPTSAYAEPTDPAPGWATRTAEGQVLAVPSGPGVHLVPHDNFDSSAHLRHSTNGTWSAAMQTDFIRPQLGTSSYDDYAVLIGERAIWDDGIYHHQVVSRVFSEGAWGPEVVVGGVDDANINTRIWLDTNYWGDAVVAWSPYPGGQVQAAVLRRGGTWQTSTTPLVIDEAKYLRYRLPQPVINNSRKVSLVWFEPTESTSGFRYQFLASGVHVIDVVASGPRTRLVWSVRSGRTFRLKTRLFSGDVLRPTSTVATKTFAASVPNGGGFRVSLSDYGPVTVSYLGSYQPGTGWGENHRAVFLSR